MKLERLNPTNAAAYRAITLEALALHPDACTSSALDYLALRDDQ